MFETASAYFIGPSPLSSIRHRSQPSLSSSQLHGLFGENDRGGKRAVLTPIKTRVLATPNVTKLTTIGLRDISKNITATESTGIGGMGGYVYDVNRLKRNLMQETVQAFKSELWTLMLKHQTATAGITEWDVVDKLAALVQASPLRTTTDSNLLDGSWCLAYTSQLSTTADLQRIINLRDRKSKRQAQQQRSSSIASVKTGLFKTTLRTFHLEEVLDDEDAYVEDETRYFGGLLSRKQRSGVNGLTRTALRLQDLSSDWYVAGGYKIAHKNNKQLSRRKLKAGANVPSNDLQVVYCDMDMCIFTQAGGTDRPFQVFTKNEAWMDPQKNFRRRVHFFVALVQNLLQRVSPTRWIESSSPTKRYDSLYPDAILREYEYDAATLRVLKLGDLSESDDEAWDGMQDPFVHLTADARQQLLKKMNVRQVEEAGSKRSSKSRRNQWLKRLFRRRKTYFKRPEDM